VKLHATLTPERLGQSTTIGFDFQIIAPAGRVPSPVSEVNISYPGEFGIALSGLGLATCSQLVLEVAGPAGCPADSRMGYGTALAEIPIGPEIIKERAKIALVRSPVQNGHIAMLISAEGLSPVDANVVFPATLLPAPAPFGGLFQINVPLVPSLPEAPDVALVEARSTLGPLHLTYYEKVNGKIEAYHPKGVLLPESCPRGGFPFGVALAFQDGTHARARTTVPCPRSRSRTRRRRSEH
jgi:hypothetical protein